MDNETLQDEIAARDARIAELERLVVYTRREVLVAEDERDEARHRIAELEELLSKKQQECNLAQEYATHRAATIRHLEAQLEVKQNNFDMAIQALAFVRKERDEARRWSRWYKRRYEYIKANVLDTQHHTRPNWLPDDDPDWKPF